MALVVADRVKETTTTTGTGAVSLDGASSNFVAFSAALSNGDTTYYAIVDNGNGDFEVGLGTYTSGTDSLSRDTILASSNAGSAVNLSAGTKDVFITYPAEKAVYLDGSDTVSSLTITSADINGGTVDGTTIGGTTPAAGTFTSFTSTGIDDNSNATAMTIDISENVGIGTTSPARRLEVQQPTTTYFRMSTGANSGYSEFAHGETTGALLISADPGNTQTGTYIQFVVDGSNAARIDASGNLGIGTTSPAQALHVAGGFKVEGEIVEEVYTLTGTTPALDPSNGTIQTWTLSGNSSPTDSLASGESMTLLIDDGTGYTITWPTMEWIGGSAPTLDTAETTVVVLWKTGSTLQGSSPGAVS